MTLPFKLTPVDIDAAEIERMLEAAHLVLKCHAASPAHDLGIRAGWRLLWHADTPPADAAIQNAMQGRVTSFLFVDEAGDAAFELIDAPWPFGMVTVPAPGRKLVRDIAAGNFDPEDLIGYWKEGHISAFAGFAAPLEFFLSPSVAGIATRVFGKAAPREKIAARADYSLLLLLCLAKAAGGALEDARFYLDAAREDLAVLEQQGVSGEHVSLYNYLESVLALETGRREEAFEHALNAVKQAPDTPEVERHLAELEERAPAPATPTWTLEEFPIDYLLDVSDPIGAVHNNVRQIALSAVTGSLKDGELLAILVMGPYRANYYYNEALERLAILNHAFEDRIREVHVITSGAYVSHEEHRQHCEQLARRLGLPFTILWDPNDWVAARVEAKGYPERFLVDKNQIVMGRERLMHEEGFWKAMARMDAAGA